MNQFDASTAISSDYGIFGLPLTAEESRLLLLPVPWEVTTSYGSGASWGPRLVRTASEQVDLFDFETGKAFEAGYHMLPFPEALKKENDFFKTRAQELIELQMNLSEDQDRMNAIRREVNAACDQMTAWVREESRKILKSGKLLGLVGGDHSTPWGAIQAVCEFHGPDVGVLHLDAHADLRQAYQGFTQSHASIMFNVMHGDLRPVKLVQVGIRDFCEEEADLIKSRSDIKTFFDLELKRRQFEGATWSQLAQEIVKELPKKVYLSFDIDGLDPSFCPRTGTPVPGGLSLDQVFYLLKSLADSGRQIVGFDLNEVSSGGGPLEEADWDGNVGARLLYKLCGWSVVTNPS